jgi:2-hydroxy-6-oxonona-2,4-dienedioate hydrolase
MNELRYRQAEQRLWAHAGLAPAERRIRLASAGVRVRVQEVGEGPPILFIHPGGANAGATWALVAARLPYLRCLLVDRPGAGLSDPLQLDPAGLKDFADRFVPDVLDAFGIDQVDLVTGSIGGYIGLRSAAAHPDRIGRIVQLGCPPFLPKGRIPLFLRVMTLPGVWRLLRILPPTNDVLRKVYRWLGHERTLEANRIPGVLWDWQMALQRYTDTARNEYAQNARWARFGRADRSLILGRSLLRSIESPFHLLTAPDDPFGGTEVVEQLVADLPNAELEIVPDVGHWPWLHDPDHAARVIERFLGGQVGSRRSA